MVIGLRACLLLAAFGVDAGNVKGWERDCIISGPE